MTPQVDVLHSALDGAADHYIQLVGQEIILKDRNQFMWSQPCAQRVLKKKKIIIILFCFVFKKNGRSSVVIGSLQMNGIITALTGLASVRLKHVYYHTG